MWKPESAGRHLQPGEGPRRGPLRGYEPSDGTFSSTSDKPEFCNTSCTKVTIYIIHSSIQQYVDNTAGPSMELASVLFLVPIIRRIENAELWDNAMLGCRTAAPSVGVGTTRCPSQFICRIYGPGWGHSDTLCAHVYKSNKPITNEMRERTLAKAE